MNLLRRLFRHRPRPHWQGEWRVIPPVTPLPPVMYYRVGEDWHRAEYIGFDVPGPLATGYTVKVEFQPVPDDMEADA